MPCIISRAPTLCRTRGAVRPDSPCSGWSSVIHDAISCPRAMATLLPRTVTVGTSQHSEPIFCDRRLCVDDYGVRSIRLVTAAALGESRLTALVAAKVARLRKAHQLDGFTAVGTPLGSAEYVSNALGRRAATVETLVDTLVQLTLSVQSQFLLMRASLQARMVHLMRTVPREALATHMRRTDAAVWRAAAAVLDMPPGVGEYGADMEGPDKACSAG